MTICAFSDGHGHLPDNLKPFDLLLIAGDNIDTYIQRDKQHTIDWYKEVFCPWVKELPFKDHQSKVIFIAGNHEVGFQKMSESELAELMEYLRVNTGDRAVYLQNEEYTFWYGDKSYKIFGTPYCKIFYNWAYMETQESLTRLYDEIPEDVDILLTHDAPYGCSDLCYGWLTWGRPPEHVGNQALRDAILKKKPKYNLHGHLHSANHEFEQLGDTQVACVSIVNEEYQVAYEPLYLEL